MSLRPKEGREGKIVDIYKAVVDGKVPGVSPEDVILVTDKDHLELYDIADFSFEVEKGVDYLRNFFQKVKKTTE